MAITIDWQNKLVESTASITDIVAFKDTIRELEDDPEGVVYPAVISYKRLDLGGGAFFHAVELINGYQMKFPNPGTYSIVGNIGGDIVPVSGVYVERLKAAAFATVSGTTSGGSGLTTEQDTMLRELWTRMALNPSAPLTNTESSITAGSIEIAVAQTSTSSTFTRT